MFTLTKKVDYALIALSHLASNGRKIDNARAIAQRYHVPISLLMNILKGLAQEGLLRSVRGSKGGYSLAVELNSVTLHRLIEILEGPVQFVQCADPASAENGTGCDLQHVCPISRPAKRVRDRLEQFLKEITVADLALDACGCGQPMSAAPLVLNREIMESKA